MNCRNCLLMCGIVAALFQGIASSGESKMAPLSKEQRTEIIEDVRKEMATENEAGQLQAVLLQWLNSANALRKMNITKPTRESDVQAHNLGMLRRASAPLLDKGNSFDALLEGVLVSDIEEYKQSIRFSFAAGYLLKKQNTKVLEILSADSGSELSTIMDVLALWVLMDTSLDRLPSEFWAKTEDSWRKMTDGKNPILRLLAVRYAKYYMTEKRDRIGLRGFNFQAPPWRVASTRP